MFTAVPRTRLAGNIKPRVGLYSFDRFDRNVARTVWQGFVGVTGAKEEVRSPVTDLFTIQVMAGIIQPSGKVIPLMERQVANLFFVEAVDLPLSLRAANQRKESSLVIFCSDLISVPQDGGTLQWSGGVSLTQIESAEHEKIELLQGVEASGPFGRSSNASETMLVNLTEGDGIPRDEASLRQQIQELQAAMVWMART
ncbi:MAG: hypothetical protein KJ732_04590 [Candidatus Margulisbacteria bacterium]|nr:hypothetical protein [Candidatus Margulisiibacteriota bacterium]